MLYVWIVSNSIEIKSSLRSKLFIYETSNQRVLRNEHKILVTEKCYHILTVLVMQLSHWKFYIKASRWRERIRIYEKYKCLQPYSILLFKCFFRVWKPLIIHVFKFSQWAYNDISLIGCSFVYMGSLKG